MAPSARDSPQDTGQNYEMEAFWENLFDPLPPVSDEEASDSEKPHHEPEPCPISDPAVQSAVSLWLKRAYPELEPAADRLPARSSARKIPNPFVRVDVSLHPRLRNFGTTVPLPKDGRLDGLIKVHLGWNRQRSASNSISVSRILTASSTPGSVDLRDHSEAIARLPPDFGRGLRLSQMEETLFQFYIVAICGTSTILPNGNYYLTEIVPIAARNDCVKHAVLALSSTYILDYSRPATLRLCANIHWRRAIHLLTTELNAVGACSPGKEDAVVAALVLISHNENVNWEQDRAYQDDPAWYRASLLAEQILAKSDPLYKFRFPSNVQCSLARIQLGNNIALNNILSATFWPSDSTPDRCPFTWLVEGTERELRKINGDTGFCPGLLHTCAQITICSAKLYKEPERIDANQTGKEFAEYLHNFRQWSDLSEGHPSAQDLINSCVLDKDGFVTSPTEATELLAETYLAATQIYLYCRHLRKPRKHAKVQEALVRLLACLGRLPTSGPLFTRNHAQFRVVMAAVVAVEPAHRRQITAWFEGLVQGPRGNIPPVWRIVPFMWSWLDGKFAVSEDDEMIYDDDDEFEENSDPWWEEMVEAICTRVGRLNLS